MKLKLDLDELKAAIDKLDSIRKPGAYINIDTEMSLIKITTVDKYDSIVEIRVFDVSTQLLPKIIKTETIPVKKV